MTELVALERESGRLVATGFFDDATAFVSACGDYNPRCNLYAGRNPRPRWLPEVCSNYLDVRHKQRAKDREIEHVTAISLDIDPLRPKGSPASEEQRSAAIEFTVKLQAALGGFVDDSGNGAYLWMPFLTPIRLHRNRAVHRRSAIWWL